MVLEHLPQPLTYKHTSESAEGSRRHGNRRDTRRGSSANDDSECSVGRSRPRDEATPPEPALSLRASIISSSSSFFLQLALMHIFAPTLLRAPGKQSWTSRIPIAPEPQRPSRSRRRPAAGGPPAVRVHVSSPQSSAR